MNVSFQIYTFLLNSSSRLRDLSRICIFDQVAMLSGETTRIKCMGTDPKKEAL